MAITDNQKQLLRMMIHYTNATPEKMAAWAGMSDADIITDINAWVTQKKANPNTAQGLISEIAALGG